MTDIFQNYWQAGIVALTILVLLPAMVRETRPLDVLALAGTSFLLLVGVLTTNEVLGLFSNSAPLTIMALFIVGAALERTGCLRWIESLVQRLVRGSVLGVQLSILWLIAPLSGFINNTPLVVMMAPVVMKIARTLKQPPSYFLIPLSYAAVLGGTLTVIGTSTNILVNGALESKGLPAFPLFAFWPIGLAVIVVGCVYLSLVSRWLLPERTSLQGLLDRAGQNVYLASIVVPAGSKFIGQTVVEAGLCQNQTRVRDIVRNNVSYRWSVQDFRLQAGDIIVLETTQGDLLTIREERHLAFHDPALESDLKPLSANEGIILEGIVGMNSRFADQKLADLRLRRLYSVYVLAVQHEGTLVRDNLSNVTLQSGDRLLIEGRREDLESLVRDGDITSLSMPQEKPLRLRHAPLALGAFVCVILLAAMDWMPIAGIALIAASFVVVTGCLKANEMYDAIDWRILFMIIGMLGIGVAFQKTGLDQIVIGTIIDHLRDAGPLLILIVLYAVVMILTEILSNNALAILATPLAVELATSLGYNYEPFVIAVMFAASHAYATPIGYQTNTFVYNLGGYKFMDFVKIGLPLNVLIMAVVIYLLPQFFPFQ